MKFRLHQSVATIAAQGNLKSPWQFRHIALQPKIDKVLSLCLILCYNVALAMRETPLRQ